MSCPISSPLWLLHWWSCACVQVMLEWGSSNIALEPRVVLQQADSCTRGAIVVHGHTVAKLEKRICWKSFKIHLTCCVHPIGNILVFFCPSYPTLRTGLSCSQHYLNYYCDSLKGAQPGSKQAGFLYAYISMCPWDASLIEVIDKHNFPACVYVYIYHVWLSKSSFPATYKSCVGNL